MEKLIWRLLTAIFILLASICLFGIGMLLGFADSLFFVCLTYLSVLGIIVGILKGVLVIIQYHISQKKEKQETKE